uniref:C-type lectin domain-containing protein n=1 Tax=Poecilia formosa TaxID=48698 RepID=A0A096M1Y9_POEFO
MLFFVLYFSYILHFQLKSRNLDFCSQTGNQRLCRDGESSVALCCCIRQVQIATCLSAAASGRHYHFIYEPKNWTNAQSYCRENYTDLVTMDNQDVVAILNDMADLEQMDPKAWIGLYHDEIRWNWLSGGFYQSDELKFQNWYPGEPNIPWYLPACGIMDRSGMWYDAPCEENIYPVCSNVSDSPPFTTQVVKLKLVGNATLDLNDPAVLENMKEELQLQLKQQGEAADVKLSWKKQQDGKIFHQEE